MEETLLKKLIKSNVEQPRFDNVIITLERTSEFSDEEMLNELQHVIAKGSHVSDLKEKDLVRVDLEKLYKPYMENGETMYRLDVTPIVIEGEPCALISDRLIKTILK